MCVNLSFWLPFCVHTHPYNFPILIHPGLPPFHTKMCATWQLHFSCDIKVIENWTFLAGVILLKMHFQLHVWNVKLCVPDRSIWYQKFEKNIFGKNIWTNRYKMGFSLKWLQGLSSVFRSKSMLFNYIIFDINNLVSQVSCKLLPLLLDDLTHKNKASFFSKIIQISSCFLFTAIFGIPLWATLF